jgi:O-antigen ligase
MPNFFLILGLSIVLGIFLLLLLKFSRDIFWGLLAVVFFLPFERIPTLEIADFTLKVNHILGTLLIIFWLLALAFGKRKVRPTGLGIPLLLLIFTLSLSLFNSQLPVRSLVFLLLNIFVILIFFIFTQLIDNKTKLLRVQKILLITITISIVFGLYQFVGDMVGLPLTLTGLDKGYSRAVFGFPRIQAFAKEPLYLGNLLLLGVGFCAAIFTSQKHFRFFYPFLILLILTIILTVSRGAIVALSIFLILWLFAQAKKALTPKTISYISLTLLVGLIALTMVFSFLGKDLRQVFVGHLSVSDLSFGESTQGRLIAFRKATDAWRTSPWIGIGLGNYGAFIVNYDLTAPEIKDIVNNQYLELLAETGILGLSSFLVLLVYLFWRSWLAIKVCQDEELKSYLIALTLALLAILVQYNFFSTLSILHIWVAMGIVVAVQNIALQTKS